MSCTGNRTALAALGALCIPVALLTAVPASADPQLPDFDAYPKADAKDYVVRDTLAYSVRGFTTPEGVFCTSSSHRGMSAVDCYGALPDAPNGANSVHLYRSGNVLTPVTFTSTTAGRAEFDGHPLTVLPVGVDYSFDQAQCLRDAPGQLACVMDNETERHGFVIGAGKTEAF